MRAIPLPVPEGLTCEFQPDRMVIRDSWREWGKVACCFFLAVILGGFAFFAPVIFADADPVAIRAIFVSCGVVTLFMVYGGFAFWFNNTDLELTPDLLRVATRPLPSHREVRVAPSAIRNVIYREYSQQGYATTYDVLAVTANGRKRLMSGKTNYEQVIFYVQQLRSALALPEGPLSPDE